MVDEVQLLNVLRQLLQANPTFNPSAELSLRAVGELGAGGMGVVYRVQDTRLGREAALKLIRGTPNPTVLARFHREVEVTAQLDHPSIPPVYDAGTNSLGQAFMVMRLVEGQTLSERVEALHASSSPDPQGERELLEAVVKLGEALAYAHSQQVIHRDLKPANVIVGRFGEVQLMDWGLAKRLDRSDDDVPLQSLIQDAPAGAELTQAGAVLGTPGYMSPEQCDGPDVDARADVFALGALLCTVLTGRPPVRKTTALNTVTATLKGEIEHPRDLRPDVPAELNAIAAAALHPDARQRTQTAAAFVADLKAYLAGQPVSAYRYRAIDRARGWARRHPTLLVATALFAALVAVAGGALAIVLQARGASAVAAVEAERAEAKAQRIEAEAQTQLAAEQTARARAEEERSRRERARAFRALAEARLAQGLPALAAALSAAALDIEDRPELRVIHGLSRSGPWRAPRVLTPSQGRAERIAWSADGRWIAAGAQAGSGRVTLFDAEQGKEVHAFDAHPGKGLGALAFSPKQGWLATGYFADEEREAPSVRVWSVPDGAQRAQLAQPLGGVLDLRWSPAGEALAIGARFPQPVVWLLDGRLLALEGAPLLWARSPAWSPDAKQIASGGLDNTVAVWSLSRPQETAEVLRGHHGHVTSVAYAPTFGRTRPWGSPDGRLASASRDATLRVWEFADPTQPQASGGLVLRTPDAAEAMAWDPGGRLLAVCCGEWVQVWDLELGRALKLRVGLAHGVAWGPRQQLAVACGDAVRVWEFGPSAAVHAFRVSDGNLAGVAWREDGASFVVAENQSGRAGKAALVGEWTPRGEPRMLALIGNVRGERVHWVPRGPRVILTASMSALEVEPGKVRDHKVSRIIDWKRDALGFRPDCFVPEGVYAGALSLDGKRYATVGRIDGEAKRGKVSLWDLETRRVATTWTVDEVPSMASAAEWTADGQLVVAWGSTLTVLDGESGELRARCAISGGKVPIMNLAARHTGSVLAVASRSYLQLFDLDDGSQQPFTRVDLERVTCLDWSVGGDFLAVGRSDELQVWRYDAEARSLTRLCSLPLDDRAVATDWNADDRLVCGLRRGTVMVLDLPQLLADPDPLEQVLADTGLTVADLERQLGR